MDMGISADYESQQTKFSGLILGEQTLERNIRDFLPTTMVPVELTRAKNEKEALRIISDSTPNLVVLDLETQRANPFKFLSTLFKSDKNCDVIVVAQRPDVSSIVKCMRLGVAEFLQLPKENQKLGECLKKISAKWQKKQRSSTLQEQQYDKFDLNHIVAKSFPMQEVIAIAQKIFRRPYVTVLICGETGTGKEVIARGIHYGTHQTKNKPFVEVNCTAIPETLLEAELFGYEKGAFTDAKFTKKGLFEMADGGTLFLDEIGDMNLLLQAKLLKAIEEKRFRRLGGTSDIQVKLRVITGTNADLEKKLQNGEFRTDLYYRLNVINIHLPPLQERGRDIVILADYFLDRFSTTYGIPRRRLSVDSEEMLENYDWPGNVRELQHVIERVVVLGENPIIELDEIKSALGIKETREDVKIAKETGWKRVIEIPHEGMSLKEGEVQLISEVLHITRGNKTHASKILGISRPRLNRKINEYQISWK